MENNCPLLLAGDYQEGFKQGWLFQGFECGQIFWIK